MVITRTAHLDFSSPLRLVIRRSWRHDEAAAPCPLRLFSASCAKAVDTIIDYIMGHARTRESGNSRCLSQGIA